jgi:hypothetical protein
VGSKVSYKQCIERVKWVLEIRIHCREYVRRRDNEGMSKEQ